MKILAFDTLIADIIIFLEKSENARAIYAELCKRGFWQDGQGKARTKDDNLYLEISRMIADSYKDPHPGGSAFNTLRAVKLALAGKKEVEVDIFSAVAAGKNGEKLASELKKAGIKLIPRFYFDELVDLLTPVSFIFTHSDGKRQILTHNGTSLNMLTAAQVTDGLIASHDAVFVGGSLLAKFPDGMFETIIRKTSAQNKDLIFALPTGNGYTAENKTMFQQIVSSQASVVLGNSEELETLTNEKDKNKSLCKLREWLKENAKFNDQISPVALITDEANPAHIVTADRILKIMPLPHPDKFGSFVGAGDSSFAGFLIGLILGYHPRIAAEMGMAFAHECLKITGAQLDDNQIIAEEALALLLAKYSSIDRVTNRPNSSPFRSLAAARDAQQR